jgi:hypothetical protein
MLTSYSAVFFFTTLRLGAGALSVGKNSDKTGNFGNFYFVSFIKVVIKLKHSACFLGVPESTDHPGQSFLSYKISFSFLFSIFYNFNNDWKFLDQKLGKY